MSSAGPATTCAAGPGEVVTANFGPRSYPVYYGTGGLGRLGALLDTHGLGRRLLVCSHGELRELYGATLERSLAATGREAAWHLFPSGERHKTAATVAGIADYARPESAHGEDSRGAAPVPCLLTTEPGYR